jgi:hypothetical protein
MRRSVVLMFVAMFLQNAFAQGLPTVPDSIKVPSDVKPLLQGHASGDQIYVCQAASSNSQFAWVLSAPEATLVDNAGTEVAKHFAGPTWQATDGSQVKGKAVAQAVADPGSIPWLLITSVDHTGAGVMSDVVTIQRINTKGGKAPVTGCDPQHQGENKRVHYTADYYFYTSVK